MNEIYGTELNGIRFAQYIDIYSFISSCYKWYKVDYIRYSKINMLFYKVD